MRFQRKTSPLTMWRASLAPRASVADQRSCSARTGASVTSATPSYCVGEPGKTNGLPVSRQIAA
jgi:hypothetical protein